MRTLAAVAAFATLVIPLAAQQREPIIDVHMHALAADAQGPPPLGMCTPFPEYSAWDPATPYGDLVHRQTQETCVRRSDLVANHR
jgi:uncharacterized protein